MFSINIKEGFRSCCTFAVGKQSIRSHFLPYISRLGTEKYSCHCCGTQSQGSRVIGLLLQEQCAIGTSESSSGGNRKFPFTLQQREKYTTRGVILI